MKNASTNDTALGMKDGRQKSPSTAALSPAQPGDWNRYETLKGKYTATATNAAEYDAALRRAVKESGV